MSDKKIYIARHGERMDFVDHNWMKTAELPHDPPLSKRGKEQATDLGKKLASLNIKHVFASPFTRCVNTAVNAAAVIDPTLKVNIEPGACEWLNRLWYRKTERGPIWRSLDGLAEEFPNINKDYKSVFPMSHNFDGFPESTRGLMDRCVETAKAIVENVVGDGNILIVGHGSSVEAFYVTLVPGLPIKPVTCKLDIRASLGLVLW